MVDSPEKKFPFSYRTVQRIKAEEYEAFFSRLERYHPYANHLGEVHWMTEAEGLQQHEFYLYEPGFWERLKKKLARRKPIDLSRLSQAERELRLQIRKYLEEKYIGRVTRETASQLPEAWQYPLSKERIEAIPITIEVLQSTPWPKGVIVGAVALLLLIFTAIGLIITHEKPRTGSILVKTNVPGTRVYMDDHEFIGYSEKVIKNVPLGKHRFRVEKSQYVATPPVQEIQIFPDSLHVLEFTLQPQSSAVIGYLKIFADYENAEVIIDDQSMGTLAQQHVFPLETGMHRVSVRKKGYVAVPPEDQVIISSGDTTVFMVNLIPLKEAGKRGRVGSGTTVGSLEVTANVSGARIYLNGRDTGEETDYVFPNLPLGKYVVRVVKEGYKVSPPEQQVILTAAQPGGEVQFTLQQNFEEVSITTEPVEADIFVDGELKGKGEFQGLLEIGEHEIRFGKVKGYKIPPSRKITVVAGEPVRLEVTLFPEIAITAEVTSNGNVYTSNCQVFTGYTYSNRGFTASNEGGPEIVFHPKLQDYVWKLGFAFPWRNPKGNDALKVTFELPRRPPADQKFILKMDAAASREKYPLALSTKVDVYIKLNGTILSYYYRPQFLEDIHGLENVEWDITRALQPGLNTLVISTRDDNNVFYYVKRIQISN